jgi:hypothetical protein
MTGELMTRAVILGLGLLGLVFASAGCNQPYVPGYSYYPQPATVEVLRRDGNRQTPLVVLASVLGVHNADEKTGIPYSVVVRMRFENVAQSNVTFDPKSLELVTGTLRGFPAPVVRPGQPMNLAPGDRRELTAYFPFAAGASAPQLNMRNLRLRWEVRIDSTAVIQTALFERVGRDDGEDADVGY